MNPSNILPHINLKTVFVAGILLVAVLAVLESLGVHVGALAVYMHASKPYVYMHAGGALRNVYMHA